MTLINPLTGHVIQMGGGTHKNLLQIGVQPLRVMQRGGARKVKQPWIRPERAGKLGGEGYLKKTAAERQRLLDRCVREWGYRSCLGSVMVLERSRVIKAKYGAKLRKDREYLRRKYGGPGAFGKRVTEVQPFARAAKVPAFTEE